MMLKRKGYYLLCGDTDSPGVQKKVYGQISELNNICPTELVCVKTKNKTIVRRLYSQLLWVEQGYDFESVLERIEDPTFLYIRRVIFDRGIISFFRRVKKKYPQCKIIVEIPTFPYFRDNYAKNVMHFCTHWPGWLKDSYYRKYLRNVVDRLVVNTFDKEVFGVKTIQTLNGVDCKTVGKINNHVDSDAINLLAVAALAPHHGYERLIKGIHKYYRNGGKREIVFHIVGDGTEKNRYAKLVEKYKLHPYVILYGKKTGKELDAIYSIADIGVESMGIYKYALKRVSTLKLGEYLSKGLPVVSGIRTLYSSESENYICCFSNDKSVVDVNRIVAFYDAIYHNKTRVEVQDMIRKFAFENFDFSNTLKPIEEYIKAEELDYE